MQIRKTYRDVNPELLFDELRDLTSKQGLILDSTKMGTYSLASDSSTFITRGTMIFKTPDENAGKECLRAHMVGMARGETKLMLDIDETAFPQEKLAALQADLDFIFHSFEVKE